MENIKILIISANQRQIDFLKNLKGYDFFFLQPNDGEGAPSVHFKPDIILRPSNHEHEVQLGESPGFFQTIPIVSIDLPCDIDHFQESIRQGLFKTSNPSTVEFSSYSLDALVGLDPAFLEAKRMIGLYASSSEPVLILGESGCGKELAARAIHELSERCKKPFVAINCSAIPPMLFESELFGSEKGAFTGAISKPGLWEKAAGGTIFLDEIGELTPELQAKLLRALENRQAHRVGGTSSYNLSARVVAATHQNLPAAIRQKGFRADFFYRISVLPVIIPPLRDRLQDLPVITRSLLEGQELCRSSLERLKIHDWPGNVRELKNVLKRAKILAGLGNISPQHLVFDKIS